MAVIFSKADQCEACFEDPAALPAARSPLYGAVASSGSRGTSTLPPAWPEHAVAKFRKRRTTKRAAAPLFEPRGVVEPFAWLIDNLKI